MLGYKLLLFGVPSPWLGLVGSLDQVYEGGFLHVLEVDGRCVP